MFSTTAGRWCCSAVAVLIVAFSSAAAGATCVPIGCDAGLTGSISGVATDCYTFEASDGEIVEITVLADTAEGEDFEPEWRLIGADGTPVGHCGAFTSDSPQDCGPLAAAGSPYRLEVRNTSAEGAGTYDVQLQRLTADAACADASPCRIDAPTESDLLSFTVAAGANVNVTVMTASPAGPNFEPFWRVLDRSGKPTDACESFTLNRHEQCGPLPASGNPYRIEVTDFFADDTGSFTASVDGVALCPGGTTPTPTPTPTPMQSCVGDCNDDRQVTVDELLVGVNIALGNAQPGDCAAYDVNNDEQITIDELLTAVNNALNGCGLTGEIAASPHAAAKWTNVSG